MTPGQEPRQGSPLSQSASAQAAARSAIADNSSPGVSAATSVHCDGGAITANNNKNRAALAGRVGRAWSRRGCRPSGRTWGKPVATDDERERCSRVQALVEALRARPAGITRHQHAQVHSKDAMATLRRWDLTRRTQRRLLRFKTAAGLRSQAGRFEIWPPESAAVPLTRRAVGVHHTTSDAPALSMITYLVQPLQ